MSAYKFSNPIRIAFEKFDGRINFMATSSQGCIDSIYAT